MKYYQIREVTEDYASVGVIKVEDGKMPLDKIEEAIRTHLDEDIKIIDVIANDYDNDIVIQVEREDLSVDEFNGELTWLYF